MKNLWQRITHWETWPFHVIYAPLGFLWLYYSIRCGWFWFFSNVDPTLEFSGFEGDSKEPMYRQLPKELYPVTIFIQPNQIFENIMRQLQDAGLSFPVAVKPDVGTQGLLFRKIENTEQLKKYHSIVAIRYLIQEMVELPLEVSVFHIRYPGEAKGKITGFIAKEYLHVVGDGKSSLLRLIQKHSKASALETEHRQKHKQNLSKIIPEKEKYFLSITGNHNRGARFINHSNEIDERLLEVFDEISLQAKYFFYGRYDIKTTMIEDLKQGKNISILEFNGTGAEPNHIYDCNMSYTQALQVIAQHWKDMYLIGRINYVKGIPYTNFWQGYKWLREANMHYRTIKKKDVELVL
ncbi:MAG: hypothetical protein ABJA79_01350 [Parafilimonas sp.]